MKMTKKLLKKFDRDVLTEERELNTNYGYRIIAFEISNVKDREHGEEIANKLLNEIENNEIDCFWEDGSDWFYSHDNTYEFSLSIDEEYIKEFNNIYKNFKKNYKEGK